MASKKLENLVKAMVEVERLNSLIKELKADVDVQEEITLEALKKDGTKKSFEVNTKSGVLVVTEYASSIKADVLSFAMAKLEMSKAEIEAEAKKHGYTTETAGYYKYKAIANK